MKFERESQRYEYPLNKDSFVVDCGGFHGRFAAEIARRYGCRVVCFEPVFTEIARQACAGLNVEVVPAGVDATDGDDVFGVQGDMTGTYSVANESKSVELIGLPGWIGDKQIDLLKLNIEGMEYVVLDALISTGKISQINRIQVQFHAPGMRSEERLNALLEKIKETHQPEWGEENPFMWISYIRK